MVDTPPDWLTPTQVATIFAVTPKTVRQWTLNGTLRAVRIGRVIRIARADVDNLLQTGATT